MLSHYLTSERLGFNGSVTSLPASQGLGNQSDEGATTMAGRELSHFGPASVSSLPPSTLCTPHILQLQVF